MFHRNIKEKEKVPNLPQAHCRLIPKSMPKLEARGLSFSAIRSAALESPISIHFCKEKIRMTTITHAMASRPYLAPTPVPIFRLFYLLQPLRKTVRFT
ncbi:MAG: hypothetical protein II278_10280, partial [Bacteroidaceae bacterium]|nr:hypothetical protein [Bacteroidaceae bacterium]